MKWYFKQHIAKQKKSKEEKKKIVLSKQLVTDKMHDAEKFYKESLAAGNEGVMLKNLGAPYKPGSRVGFMVKLKPVMETLDTRLHSGHARCGQPFALCFAQVGRD